jgi:hypothetical protein
MSARDQPPTNKLYNKFVGGLPDANKLANQNNFPASKIVKSLQTSQTTTSNFLVTKIKNIILRLSTLNNIRHFRSITSIDTISCIIIITPWENSIAHLHYTAAVTCVLHDSSETSFKTSKRINCGLLQVTTDTKPLQTAVSKLLGGVNACMHGYPVLVVYILFENNGRAVTKLPAHSRPKKPANCLHANSFIHLLHSVLCSTKPLHFGND